MGKMKEQFDAIYISADQSAPQETGSEMQLNLLGLVEFFTRMESRHGVHDSNDKSEMEFDFTNQRSFDFSGC